MSQRSRISLVLFAALLTLAAASQAQPPANQQHAPAVEAQPASSAAIEMESAAYGSLHAGSDSAWDRIRVGFLESDQALADSWNKAVRAFQSERSDASDQRLVDADGAADRSRTGDPRRSHPVSTR